jgi:hypothetical protein
MLSAAFGGPARKTPRYRATSVASLFPSAVRARPRSADVASELVAAVALPSGPLNASRSRLASVT